MTAVAQQTLTEFLLARVSEDEAVARQGSDILSGPAQYGHQLWSWGDQRLEIRKERVLAECEVKRAIVALHESWPVMLESPPQFEHDTVDATNSIAMRMSQNVELVTQRQYRERFGTEPPTAPMLKAMALVYADHPDFREAWRP